MENNDIIINLFRADSEEPAKTISCASMAEARRTAQGWQSMGKGRRAECSRPLFPTATKPQEEKP